METDSAPPLPTDRLKNSLEEVRASVAGQETNKGLARVVQEVMPGVLNLLMALLEDFRAGRLAPLAPCAPDEAAGDGGVSVAGPRPAPQSGAKWLGLRGWWRGKSAVPQESECEEEAPTPALPRSAGEGAIGANRAAAHPSPSRVRGPRPLPQGERDSDCPSRSPRIKSAGEPHFAGRGILCGTVRTGEEDDPALCRADGPRISPSSARADDGCIEATKLLF